MNAVAGVYAAPKSDEQDEEDAPEAEESGPPAVWYAIPLWRLWFFSLLGGTFYQLYWMYRCWRAFRESMGYSERERWIARYEHNGFRASPFWRAGLGVYSYCWLVVVRREARLRGVSGFGPPWLWFSMQLSAVLLLPFGWNLLALSLAFLPAQLAVNRMHDKLGGSGARASVTAAELCWLIAGALFMVQAAATLGVRL